MQNLILDRFASGYKYSNQQVIYLGVSNSDYLRVIAGKMIKIDARTSTMIGKRFRLCSEAGFGYYYLYAVIGEYGFFSYKL
jgi:hypothetical protein